MHYLYIITIFAIFVSFISDREKTIKALKIAFKKLVKVLKPLLTMIIFVSLALTFVPDRIIYEYLADSSNNRFVAMAIAAFLGSITLMPGFIAFPLSGILLNKGVPYMVLSAFTTTLMMVGVLTAPLEKKYFGMKVTVIRNVISFGIAIIVALVTGVFFWEIF